jgi:hypothetical protein
MLDSSENEQYSVSYRDNIQIEQKQKVYADMTAAGTDDDR